MPGHCFVPPGGQSGLWEDWGTPQVLDGFYRFRAASIEPLLGAASFQRVEPSAPTLLLFQQGFSPHLASWKQPDRRSRRLGLVEPTTLGSAVRGMWAELGVPLAVPGQECSGVSRL